MAQFGCVQTAQDLMNLSSMLNRENEASDDEDTPDSSTPSLTPASIGPNSKKSSKKIETPYAKVDSDPNNIWNENEVKESNVFAGEADPRPQPKYEISYKQKVTSEDMFLGMSGKNPSTACCEDMIVRIELPGCNMKDVELDVKQTTLDCRSNKFRLLLALPHPVDSKKGSAKWDGNKHTLQVTLTMNREYDFVNFQ
ncbi:dynein axonemal assembly factor 6 [Ciona intestinalis]